MYRGDIPKKRTTGGGETSNAGTSTGNSADDPAIGWDWEVVYKNAIRAGIRPDEFWDLTPVEYNLIIEAYQEKQKTEFYRDIRNDYYTGVFAQASKPQEFYDSIIEGIDKKPQTGEEIFNLLKQKTEMLNGSRPIIIGSNFSIPLKLTPSFDVGIFSYFYKMQNDSEKLFQPDVALSIDGTLLKPKDGTYAIRPGIMKIKYCGQVYTIVALRSGV